MVAYAHIMCVCVGRGGGAPYNTKFYEWMWKNFFRFCQTTKTGNRTPLLLLSPLKNLLDGIFVKLSNKMTVFVSIDVVCITHI